MQITKERLRHIIQEELTDAEEKRKCKLEAELEDLEHKWMKEAKLSSVLMERYDISEEDSHGKVLWHSLDENGHIDSYDVRFGDTIIRSLTEADIIGEASDHKRDDKHGAQKPTDRKRRKRREWRK